MSPAPASEGSDQPDPRPTKEKGPRAKPLAAKPKNTIHPSEEENDMSSSTTVPQTAVMPEGVEPIVTFPLDVMPGVFETTGYVAYFEYPDGTRDWEGDPDRPTPEFIGTPWLDGKANIVTFLGLYKITNVEDGEADGLLKSTFPCTAYGPEKCTGHSLDHDGTIYLPRRHDAPDRDLVSLMGEHVVWGQSFLDESGPQMVVMFEQAEVTTDGPGLLELAAELESLASLLKSRASEMGRRGDVTIR